jgi:hypothetical protein
MTSGWMACASRSRVRLAGRRQHDQDQRAADDVSTDKIPELSPVSFVNTRWPQKSPK